MPKLLFADDDLASLDLLSGLAGIWGYETCTVHDSREVLPTALAAAPDIILLDVLMPYMDGFQVLQRLRSEPATACVPVIFLTAGRTDAPSRAEGLELGATDYVSKPVEPAELRLRIERILQSRRESQAREARDLEIVRSMATFLSHRFNNLLCVIQLSADMIAQQGGAGERRRAGLITDKVSELQGLLKALQNVRRVATTTYVGDRMMLDLDEAVRSD